MKQRHSSNLPPSPPPPDRKGDNERVPLATCVHYKNEDSGVYGCWTSANDALIRTDAHKHPSTYTEHLRRIQVCDYKCQLVATYATRISALVAAL